MLLALPTTNVSNVFSGVKPDSWATLFKAASRARLPIVVGFRAGSFFVGCKTSIPFLRVVSIISFFLFNEHHPNNLQTSIEFAGSKDHASSCRQARSFRRS